MKKLILLLTLLQGAYSITDAQTVTRVGTGSGSLGTDNSFFGFNAGNTSSALSFNNCFFGSNAGAANANSIDNTGIGAYALKSNGGTHNTAIGSRTLFSNVNGNRNTAVGISAMYSNTSGSFNTALGGYTLYNNTTGEMNVGIGLALFSNTTGSGNTASGYNSLHFSTTGHNNVANGAYSLYKNTTGSDNTAMGSRSLQSNTTGNNGVAIGFFALHKNTTGKNNTATGHSSLTANTTGEDNVANGFLALGKSTTGYRNTGVGASALENNITGSYNTAVGYNSGPYPAQPDLTNTTSLGNGARPTASYQVRIGNVYVQSIGGAQPWSVVSDGRFKKDIKEDVSGLDFILQLRPVSYTLDTRKLSTFLGTENQEGGLPEARKDPVRQTGFIAQEVATVIKNSRYIFYGVEEPKNEKDHYSLRYSEFVVPLVKAVQELNAKNKALDSRTEQLVRLAEEQQRKIEAQQAKIDVLLSFLNDNGLALDQESSSEGMPVLFQNFPNGFGDETEIKMIVPQKAIDVSIIVYDRKGVKLKSIPVQGRGETSIKISSNELSVGAYTYCLMISNRIVDSKTFTVTK
jgi:hypothetical protein